MPQLNRGGKYVFGISVIGSGGRIQLPEELIDEYQLRGEERVIVFTGSKITGGFCATTKKMLSNSKLKHILDDCPELADFSMKPGAFIRYKGRGYAWLPLAADGTIALNGAALKVLGLSVGDLLMSIRSSDIAFTMGARGPLMDRARAYPGSIEICRAG